VSGTTNPTIAALDKFLERVSQGVKSLGSTEVIASSRHWNGRWHNRIAEKRKRVTKNPIQQVSRVLSYSFGTIDDRRLTPLDKEQRRTAIGNSIPG